MPVTLPPLSAPLRNVHSDAYDRVIQKQRKIALQNLALVSTRRHCISKSFFSFVDTHNSIIIIVSLNTASQPIYLKFLHQGI